MKRKVAWMGGLWAALMLLGGCFDGAGVSGADAPASPSVQTSNTSTTDAGAGGAEREGAQTPGGLYVGYYAESAAENPEDPTLGAFSLNLPPEDGAFRGNMFFPYLGYQRSNLGTVAGTKQSARLSGTWTGTIDDSPQRGTYSGDFDTLTQSYSGVYANEGGKQFMDREPCISYFIGPHGTWEMFPLEAHVPEGFSVTVSGRRIGSTGAPGGQGSLVYVLDPVLATSGANPVLWQTLVGPGTGTSIPEAILLTPGRSYVAVVTIADANNRRVAFGSRVFTAN